MDVMSGAVRTSIDASVNADNDGPGLQANLRRKQFELLHNPSLKTSLTTNIRNIMRNQDKGLLTTSTRLLNAQVKRAEMRTEMDKMNVSMSPDDKGRLSKMTGGESKKAISTIDLLKKQKEMH